MRLWGALTQTDKAWPRDEQGRIILFQLPPLVNLSAATEAPPDTKSNDNPTNPQTQTTPPTTETSASPPILNLPPEVVHNIVSFLHPVDRVCLALTSKKLAGQVLSAPRLSPNTWGRFTEMGNTNLAPDCQGLILRLAHGWVPKDRWRYCWTCNKIVTRDPQYFETRLRRTKKPRWSTKLNVDQDVWTEWTKDQRCQHLIRMWSVDRGEDSSSLFCHFCRSAQMAEPARHPSQCPKCLEDDLTYKFKPNRRSQAISFVENTLVVVTYVPAWAIIFALRFLAFLFPACPFLIKLKAKGYI